jgi:hypothetical protein
VDRVWSARLRRASSRFEHRFELATITEKGVSIRIGALYARAHLSGGGNRSE